MAAHAMFARMKKKPWGGRFKHKENPLMEDFNSSLHFDKKLYQQDLAGPHGRRDVPVHRTVALSLAAGCDAHLGGGTGCAPGDCRACDAGRIETRVPGMDVGRARDGMGQYPYYSRDPVLWRGDTDGVGHEINRP